MPFVFPWLTQDLPYMVFREWSKCCCRIVVNFGCEGKLTLQENVREQ